MRGNATVSKLGLAIACEMKRSFPREANVHHRETQMVNASLKKHGITRYIVDRLGGFEWYKVFEDLQGNNKPETFWGKLARMRGSDRLVKAGYIKSMELIADSAEDLKEEHGKEALDLILDLGSSGAEPTRKMAEMGLARKVIGVDIDKNAIEFAREKGKHLGESIGFINADILKFDELSRATKGVEADLIRSVGLGEYIPVEQRMLFLDNVMRCLKLDGVLVLGVTMPPEYWEIEEIDRKTRRGIAKEIRRNERSFHIFNIVKEAYSMYQYPYSPQDIAGLVAGYKELIDDRHGQFSVATLSFEIGGPYAFAVVRKTSR